MKLRLALAAATCLVLPLAAHAQPVTGPYVAAGAGSSFLGPVNNNFQYFTRTGNEPTERDFYFKGEHYYPGKWQMRPSYAGVGSVGYGFGNGFRVELGGNFYRNTFHANDGSLYEYGRTFTFHNRSFGGMNTYGPMANGYYDFNVGLPIYPYIGAGVGYQFVKLNSNAKDMPHQDLGYFGQTSGTQGSFAYQIIAGLAYPLTMITPGLSLTAEYRFMQLVSSRNYDNSYSYDHGKDEGHLGNTKIGQQFYNTVLLGFRYQIFNPPPPPPAPAPMPAAAPAPAPAKTYLVFFDWDKYNLTPRATQIIAQAAADSKTTQVTTIAVSGYTDTSGTPNYNLGLSVRRAKSVAAQLVADGVPASEIETNGFGETHLLVPTGPGVREPQNRRVEIVFN